ncbi:unnamed protein product [Acanthoscelides obtectus]|uniref:Large ribosomal subunit protein mL50 n=1 Tax=Acanthoscelides obtectus TaxID=200917 RepID=A0A9P0MIV1_ACAOB|nr:unnamed protein product [Acanthoscelides obtectus]CAH2013814.1 unnamed protein product [Acanthoscelides obtectus]CAK1630321.1 39S ribosomal protein L50, mitochondrial [Acanthoscelides obtectus]CAK1630325.1 39S ribosomal protein L50, mitochondrial [Acanthoscelides obtectus]
MAVFLRHGVFKTGQLISSKNVVPRAYATKAEKKKGIDRKVGPKIDSTAQSLAAKGFLRPQKDYTPPRDVHQLLDAVFQTVLGHAKEDFKLSDISQRFKVFKACYDKTGHSIPNSLLYTIQTLKDVKTFYLTPVDTRTPLDKMRNMELPENLHVEFDYHRFHPDKDTRFGGQTAFNGSSTIVTGLKYKDKYPGHTQYRDPSV